MKKKIFFIITFLLLIGSAEEVFAKKTIGVTRFKNITKNKTINWLGAGIAESITQKLSLVDDYILIERMNVDKITGEIAFGQSGIVDENNAKKAGKAMGADIIIIGNYQKYGKQIKIIAKLVEVESHRIIKQVQARGVMKDIFDLQDEIAIKLIEQDKQVVTKKIKQKIAKNYTTNISAYEYYAKGQDLILKENKYDEAIKMFKKAISIDKNYCLAYSGLGKTYSLKSWAIRTYKSKEDKSLIEKSYKNSKKALAICPDLDEAHLSLARFYQEADEKKYPDKWDLCEKEAKKAIEINPNNSEAYFVLSRRFGYDEKLEEEYIRKALEKNKYLTDAHINMGIIHLNRNQLDLAEKSFKTAIEIDPNYAMAYMNLGVVYDRRKQFDKAVELYQIIVEKYPKYVLGLMNLGIGYEALNKYDEALKYYEKARDINPKDYEPWSRIAYIYVLKKQYKKAIGFYKKSLNKKSDYYYSLANIGYCYSKLEDYDKAISFIEKAHKQDIKQTWPAKHLAWLYRYKLNNKEKAKYWYNEVLKRDPNDSETKKNLEGL